MQIQGKKKLTYSTVPCQDHVKELMKKTSIIFLCTYHYVLCFKITVVFIKLSWKLKISQKALQRNSASILGKLFEVLENHCIRKFSFWDFLVVQWLKLHFAMQQMLVQFLVKELRAHIARGLYSYVLKLEPWPRPRGARVWTTSITSDIVFLIFLGMWPTCYSFSWLIIYYAIPFKTLEWSWCFKDIHGKIYETYFNSQSGSLGKNVGVKSEDCKYILKNQVDFSM